MKTIIESDALNEEELKAVSGGTDKTNTDSILCSEGRPDIAPGGGEDMLIIVAGAEGSFDPSSHGNHEYEFNLY